MVDAFEFMKHWKKCCSEQKNCKGCFIEYECQMLVDRRSDKTIQTMIEKIEKRYSRRHAEEATE